MPARKMTLLFTAPGVMIVGEKNETKDEVAVQTGVNPDSLTAPPEPAVVYVIEAHSAAKTEVPPPAESRDVPHQRSFTRKPPEMNARSLVGTRKASRFRMKPPEGDSAPTGEVPGVNPLLQKKP